MGEGSRTTRPGHEARSDVLVPYTMRLLLQMAMADGDRDLLQVHRGHGLCDRHRRQR